MSRRKKKPVQEDVSTATSVELLGGSRLRSIERLLDFVGQLPANLHLQAGLVRGMFLRGMREHLLDIALLSFDEPGMHLKHLPVEPLEGALTLRAHHQRHEASGLVLGQLGSYGASFLTDSAVPTFLDLLVEHARDDQTPAGVLQGWFERVTEWFCLHYPLWREGFLQRGGLASHLNPPRWCLEVYMERLELHRTVVPVERQVVERLRLGRGQLERGEWRLLGDVLQVLRGVQRVEVGDDMRKVLRSSRHLKNLEGELPLR